MIKAFIKNPHTRDTLNLAWPLVLTQVGYVVTGMVDNIFLGRLGAAEQAAGILSNNLYVLVLVFCIGVSYAATPLVTAAHEKNDLIKKASLFKNSLALNILVAVGCFLILFLASDLLKFMHQPEEVVALAIPFFNVLILSMIPVSLFFTCKQYCEGLSNTRAALVISIIGNILNIILNYLLIYGKMGMPHMGYMGSATASFISRIVMGLAFLILIFRSKLTKEIRAAYKAVKINWVELRDLARIGFNAGLQFTVEVAAFAVAGFMAGTFGKEQIDAHGIALSIAALTYMFGSGISSAASIRASMYKAQGNWIDIRHSSNTALTLVLLIMGLCGVIFLLFSKYLPMLFSTETEIIQLASKLLIIAAMFQLFDGMQVTILGVLRGLEDVKIPTIITLIGYWVIAIPLAYLLAFTYQLETVGIWLALLIALAVVAAGLYWRLMYLFKKNIV
jgi:MATE family multidrug resistance protein